MSPLLCLETAGQVGSVAVLDGAGGDWQLLGGATSPAGQVLTRRLLPMVEEVLGSAGVTPPALDAVVVGTGPGTFTGVRVGVATARAMALALGVPVVGVSSLSALAASVLVGGHDAPGGGVVAPRVIVPVLDARRGEVFAAVYRRDAGETWERLGEIIAVSPAGLDAEVTAIIAGHGPVRECAGPRGLVPPLLVGALNGGLVEDAEPLIGAQYLVRGQEHLREPGASVEGDRLGPWLAHVIAAGRSSGPVPRPGEPGSPEAVRPIYVRAPDADVHIAKMRDPWGT